MTLIDTHTHLYLKDFELDIQDIISRANTEGVTRFFLPAIDSGETYRLLKLEERFPQSCFAMNGLHPCSVKNDFETELQLIYNSLLQRKFVAIGEAGLDFYWDRTFEKEQYRALEQQLQWALEFKIPIVLHTRNATRETIDIVKPYAAKGVTGIFHCFSGNIQNARDIINMGFYLGIGGVLTYKNSGLDKIVEQLDISNLVLETDAPYLTPVPYRGKRNESSYLKIIATKLSEIKRLSIEEVAGVTSENAQKIFNF